MQKTFIFIIILLFSILTYQFEKTDLNQNWKMEVLGGNIQADKLKGKSFDTNIPTTVHLDLQKHN